MDPITRCIRRSILQIVQKSEIKQCIIENRYDQSEKKVLKEFYRMHPALKHDEEFNGSFPNIYEVVYCDIKLYDNDIMAVQDDHAVLFG